VSLTSSPSNGRVPVILPLMIPTIVEQHGHVAGVAVLYGQGLISVADATAAAPDSLLRVLFVLALAVTPQFTLAELSSQPAWR
jgi:hypothetical protein